MDGGADTRVLSVAVAQLGTVPYDADRARATTVRWLNDGFGQGADVIVLPELVVPGYGLDPAAVSAAAEPLDGPIVEAWTAAARHAGGLVVGGFAERDGEALYNSAVAVSGDGVLLHYRKLHCFAREREVFAPGDLGLPVVDTEWGRIGVCVCYDLRFVETLRILSLAGAELVCVPTAWVGGFDPSADPDAVPPQATGAMVQANLDQVFVACASQTGRPGEIDLLGGSLVVDPWGKPRVEPLPRREERLAFADIDLADVRTAHARGAGINPREDRRSDVYSLELAE